jgi:hypothetical protein
MDPDRISGQGKLTTDATTLPATEMENKLKMGRR